MVRRSVPGQRTATKPPKNTLASSNRPPRPTGEPGVRPHAGFSLWGRPRAPGPCTLRLPGQAGVVKHETLGLRSAGGRPLAAHHRPVSPTNALPLLNAEPRQEQSTRRQGRAVRSFPRWAKHAQRCPRLGRPDGQTVWKGAPPGRRFQSSKCPVLHGTPFPCTGGRDGASVLPSCWSWPSNRRPEKRLDDPPQDREEKWKWVWSPSAIQPGGPALGRFARA